MAVQERLELILAEYVEVRTTTPYSGASPIRIAFDDAVEELMALPPVGDYRQLDVKPSAGKGRWARVPWIALIDERETTSVTRGVYGAFLFREDMSGVYLTLSQGVTGSDRPGSARQRRRLFEERKTFIRHRFPRLAERFRLDDQIDLARAGDRPGYERGTIAYKFYERGAVPADEEIEADLALLLDIYRQYVEDKSRTEQRVMSEFDRRTAVATLIDQIAATGFQYPPWQIAAYVTALRTKPFVILAGVSGSGKSKLPVLVARATGGETEMIPVRPDWTDSSEVLGMTNLQGVFQPGPLLRAARSAGEDSDHFHVCVLDEMNLARVEHYSPEFLSFIESREHDAEGTYRSRPLLPFPAGDHDGWGDVELPPNFAIVGTVNMDETTQPFSRKVLDRAFTLELGDIDLTQWRTAPRAQTVPGHATWPVAAWRPRALELWQIQNLTTAEETLIDSVMQTVVELNRFLLPAQLHVSRRVSKEIALFLLHAAEIRDLFGDVDPLDLALQMKILPRIAGDIAPVHDALLHLLGWSINGSPFLEPRDAQPAVRRWEDDGQPAALAGARFPRTAARLALMWRRYQLEGSTSFWL